MAGKPGMHKERQDYRFGTEYQAKLRAKIKTGMILGALADHVEGKKEMSSTQIQAAVALLRKAMPDLASTEIKQDATSYRDTLSRIAEMAGWAVAASQVAQENAPNATQPVDSIESAQYQEDGTGAGEVDRG